YVFLFLLLASIHKDLSAGTPPPDETSKDSTRQSAGDFSVIQVKALSGETVLSIVERINPAATHLIEIEQIMDDFKALNPDADPHHLKQNTYYNFPRYPN